MNKMFLFGCMGILAVSTMLGSCSENDNPVPTDGGLKAYNQILFSEDGKENSQGNVIGNGDQEIVFTGKQTLKKGT